MNKLKFLIFAGTLAFGGMALTACDDPGPAEQAGREIDEAVEEAGEAIEEAEEEIEEAVEDLREEVD